MNPSLWQLLPPGARACLRRDPTDAWLAAWLQSVAPGERVTVPYRGILCTELRRPAATELYALFTGNGTKASDAIEQVAARFGVTGRTIYRDLHTEYLDTE